MYITIIISAGPCWMTAACMQLAAISSNDWKVKCPGGQMNNTSDIENYPGYANISVDLS